MLKVYRKNPWNASSGAQSSVESCRHAGDDVSGQLPVVREEHVAEELLGQGADVVLGSDEGQVAAVEAAQAAGRYLEQPL